MAWPMLQTNFRLVFKDVTADYLMRCCRLILIAQHDDESVMQMPLVPWPPLSITVRQSGEKAQPHGAIPVMARMSQISLRCHGK